MNASQLIEALLKVPGDTPVILSSDGEGSTCSPLDSADPGLYLAENSYSGEHYTTGDPFDAPDGSVPAVFLWPTN